MPTRQLLDLLVPDRPAYLISYDGHTGWANTRALKAAGISRTTRNPPNGIIVRDPRTGEPTGALKETAMSLVANVAPQPSEEDRLAAIRAAIDEAHSLGITSVHDTWGTAADLELFDRLRKRNLLSLRVYLALGASASLTEEKLKALDQVRERFPDDPVLKTGAIKLVVDGVIESHTAAMPAPYANRPSARGEPQFTPEQLTRVVGMIDGSGWQVMTHAVGDAAVRMTLDAYEAAAKANAPPAHGRRHRIEHVQVIDPIDVPRFGRLGVIASMQPLHATAAAAAGSVWNTNLGDDRASRGWPWARIAKHRGPIAFGSDWPVMTMDPRAGLHFAVTRPASAVAKASAIASAADRSADRTGPASGSERLSLRQAIQAYTRDAAWASFDEQRKGILARDMLADIVILSENIFTGPPARLLETEVVVTIADGKVVYRRDPPETTTAQ